MRLTHQGVVVTRWAARETPAMKPAPRRALSEQWVLTAGKKCPGCTKTQEGCLHLPPPGCGCVSFKQYLLAGRTQTEQETYLDIFAYVVFKVD